jgi:hypothetical protein
LIVMATARLVNSSTVSAVCWPATASPTRACPPNSEATTAVPTNDRRMSARTACPSSKASHAATATPSSRTSNPVPASATQLGTSPSGITRMALPSAKNSVATTTTPVTERGRRPPVRARTRAPSVASEMTPNITQCPGRSGPPTPPASTAPLSANAATIATVRISPIRLRQVSPGRDNSSSTANHATPGTATR